MKHLISLKEQSAEDLNEILSIAKKIKEKHGDYAFLKDETINPFCGKKVLMLFEKNSTRTKLSFIGAAIDLQGHYLSMDALNSQSKIANLKDELKAMMLYADVLVYRALDVKSVKLASSLNMVPVIDGCSNKYHPAQALGDILTMSEHAGGIEKIKKVAWLGIENNVRNTLALACHKLGINLWIASPYVHAGSIDEELESILDASPYIHKTTNIAEALDDAQFVHTDTWMDMEYFDGIEIKSEFLDEYNHRTKILAPFQLSADLLKKHDCDAKIMHCMPCHEGYEITRDAIDHENSIVFPQAENRLHIEKAMLWWLMENKQNVAENA